MMNNNTMTKAWKRYQENGAISVAKAGINATDFCRMPFLKSIVSNKYENIMIGSEELKKSYASRYWDLPENLDGLHPNLNEEIAPLQGEGLRHQYSPRFSFKQPFVAEVPDATIVGPDAVAITADGRCILDTLNSIPDARYTRFGGALKKAVTGSPTRVGTALWNGRRPPANQSESAAAVLHNYWTPNYYHWVLEELLKLRGIWQYERATGNDVTLLIPSDPPTYVTESLALLGYEESDYMEWDNTSLNVERLVVPSFPELTPKTIAWLQNEMTSRINPSTTTSQRKWVYISRQKSAMRRVANYTEVEAVLSKYDIHPIACEDLSLKEQIELFSSVDGIVGPHGAGLTAAVWGSDMQLIELFNDIVQAPYYLLTYVLGFEYTALSGDAVGNVDDRRNKNIHIDSNELEKICNRVIA